jgi:NTE family protein
MLVMTDTGLPRIDPGPRIGLILGGGGVVGVAWELGVLAAIATQARWNPADATVIAGTSAGSMAGAITALGRDLPAIAARRTAGVTLPDVTLPDVTTGPTAAPAASAVPPELLDLLQPGSAPVEERARAVGRLARTATPSMDAAAYRAYIGSSLPGRWPDGDLRVTTVDCETGDTVLIDRHFGLDLIDAVSASCAIPGYFPTVEYQGRHFTDGPRQPYVEALAAELALDAIVFVGLRLPFVAGAGEHPELDALAAGGRAVVRVTTGPAFLASIGSNLMDPAAVKVATLIGLADGEGAADAIRQTVAAAAG